MESKAPAVSEPATSTAQGVSDGVSVSWDASTEKRLVRKIDLRIFPVMVILFILNFIDRNNFANARLGGLEKDLSLTDVQYQTCLSILLVGYVSMQVPSNLILNAISRPSWYLCACVAIWGVISAATGAVHNAVGTILCRFFLGCIEASLFPGGLYFLSRWYTRREMQLRVTILNAGNLAAQAFGGLIAAGILADMEGDGGLRAWRWLFIIEGAITIAIAGIAVFILPDYPSSTSWLSSEEKRIAEGRLALDAGLAGADAADKDVTAMQGVLLAIKDVKVWLLGVTYLATIMGLSVRAVPFVYPPFCYLTNGAGIFCPLVSCSFLFSSPPSLRLSTSTPPRHSSLLPLPGSGPCFFPSPTPGMLTGLESVSSTSLGRHSLVLWDISFLRPPRRWRRAMCLCS